jgi:hypothetical protein
MEIYAYHYVLLAIVAIIITAFMTGHAKLGVGIAVFTVVAVVLFYATVIYALNRWSSGGK